MDNATAPPITIIEFLIARLDEREQAAKTCADAFPSPWELSDRGWLAKVTADGPVFRIVAELAQSESLDGEGWVGDYLQHIALHDPASVLRDIAAKRAVLEECAYWRDRVEASADAGLAASDYGADQYTVAAPILRHLASAYADHSDYRDEWKL
jgi:hypothetical protein